MIVFLVLLFLAGAALTAYGIWEQKNVYGDQYFAAGKVVAYAKYRASGPALIMGAVANMQHPVVSVTLESGEQRQLRIHTAVPYGVLGIGDNFPELKIGGELSVTYFGKNPKEAFLVDHPMAQTPVKTSTFLLLGIALVGTAIVTILGWVWLAQSF